MGSNGLYDGVTVVAYVGGVGSGEGDTVGYSVGSHVLSVHVI